MKKASTTETKLFIGFGIITIISGIYLTIQEDYVSGISGTIVGIFILYLNVNKTKGQKNE